MRNDIMKKEVTSKGVCNVEQPADSLRTKVMVIEYDCNAELSDKEHRENRSKLCKIVGKLKNTEIKRISLF